MAEPERDREETEREEPSVLSEREAMSIITGGNTAPTSEDRSDDSESSDSASSQT